MHVVETARILWDLLIHSKKPEARASSDTPCNADGAPPMTTVEPITIRPYVEDGRILSFDQSGVTRYALLNLPRGAKGNARGRKWPLFIYLHGSRTMPQSIYSLGKELFEMRDTFPLSGDPETPGFILLSVEGRRAMPAGALSGTGFHWDEWYRNPAKNLDAIAVDHFVDEVVATGLVDPNRIYVFGWSNGAYMAVLYGIWRGDRIAAIGQYAGADPFSREPCRVPFTYSRRVPIVLLRNLCDALVPCTTTSVWIETLRKMDWPFAYENLSVSGELAAHDASCDGSCGKVKGLYCHVRWPKRDALFAMLRFMQQNPLASADAEHGRGVRAHDGVVKAPEQA